MAHHIRYTPPQGPQCDEVHAAIFDGESKPVLELLERTDRCWNPNRPDAHGWTYLMHACWINRSHDNNNSLVRLLLGCRADVNLTCCATRVTPLHLAFARSDARLAALLLLMGADAQAIMYPSGGGGEDLTGGGGGGDGGSGGSSGGGGGDGDGDGGSGGGGGGTGSGGVGMKPHSFQNPAFTAEVVAEYKSLQVEEPQLARQRLWQAQSAHSILGAAEQRQQQKQQQQHHSSPSSSSSPFSSSAAYVPMPVEGDAGAAVLMPPAPAEPRGVSAVSTAAMRALIYMPAPDIAPVGVDLERLVAGGILRPPPFPK
jgi:hypothetical protein